MTLWSPGHLRPNPSDPSPSCPQLPIPLPSSHQVLPTLSSKAIIQPGPSLSVQGETLCDRTERKPVLSTQPSKRPGRWRREVWLVRWGPLPRPGPYLPRGSLLFIYLFFPFIFISWRLIALQYCSGFAIH